MEVIKTAFLLAAPSSGSGKTTLTLALLRLFAERGLTVQPFKCGPDYLDTRLHSLAASWGGKSRTGINLDTFMASKEHAQKLFYRYSSDADASIVEGVMGLFDGAEKSEGSSAEIATTLGIPVIMVVNAQSMAYSAAPLLYGFRTFDPRLNLAGVIFNQVNSLSHYRYLEAAAQAYRSDEIHLLQYRTQAVRAVSQFLYYVEQRPQMPAHHQQFSGKALPHAGQEEASPGF